MNKYLTQGLIWWKDYRIQEILENQGIVPGHEYTLGNITGAIEMTIHKNVEVRCFYDPHTTTVFLLEILFCFDKNLTLINCNLMQEKGIRDCGMEWDMITYPDVVPPLYSYDE